MAKLPPITSTLAPDVRLFLERVREAFTSVERVEAGLANRLDLIGQTDRNFEFVFDPNTGYQVEIPPALLNLQASSGLNMVFLQWEIPPFNGYLYTEVWASTTPALGDAELIGISPGTLFTHDLNWVTFDPSQEDDPNQRWYWVRALNINTIPGPYNATKGVQSAPAPSPDVLVDLLQGRVGASQLTSELGSRINKIETLEAETQTLEAEINSLINAPTFDSTKDYEKGAIVAYESRLYQALVAIAAGGAAPPDSSDWNDLGKTESVYVETAKNRADITQINLVDANSESPAARAIAAVQASAQTNQGDIVSVRQTIATQADEITGLSGQYTVKIDANGFVSGFGLASTGTDKPTSEFMVRADRFAVGSPSVPGSENFRTPFVVQTTQDGVAPPGVYIDDAFIKNASITGAKIGTATITKANIQSVAAESILAGSLTAGRYIGSTLWDPSRNLGWRIYANGDTVFNNAVVRGTVYATDGYFKGDLYGGDATSFSNGVGLFSGTEDDAYKFRVGAPGEARVQWDGAKLAIFDDQGNNILQSGDIDWNLIANKPAFGSLATQDSVSTNQVTGLGSLATQSSVNWASQVTNKPNLGSLAFMNSLSYNQLRNPPSFGNFAFLNKVTASNIANYMSSAAISNAYIANGAITTAKIATAAIGRAKIADGAINYAKIANGSVTNAKIGNAQITTAKIKNAAIDTLKIAGNSVTVSVARTGSGSLSISSTTGFQSIIVVGFSYARNGDCSADTGYPGETYISISGPGVKRTAYSEGNCGAGGFGGNQATAVVIAVAQDLRAGTHTYSFSSRSARGRVSGFLLGTLR